METWHFSKGLQGHPAKKSQKTEPSFSHGRNSDFGVPSLQKRRTMVICVVYMNLENGIILNLKKTEQFVKAPIIIPKLAPSEAAKNPVLVGRSVFFYFRSASKTE